MIHYSKYRAQPVYVDDIRFHSRKEARRYTELKLLERVGQISELELQPKFPFHLKGDLMFTYKADFRYKRSSGETIIEDVKGFRTALYKLKKKVIEKEYEVVIVEV